MVVALFVCASPLAAQSEPGAHTFFTGRDGAIGAAFLAASAGLSIFDARIARQFQDSTWAHVRIGREWDRTFSHINETTLTVGGLGVYAIARLFGAHDVSDIAFHAAESVAAASLTAQVIRGPLGRTRPKDAAQPYEDQYEFHFLKGFAHFQQRAFPSIHSSSGFAAASAIVAEVHERAPGATWWVGVPAYAMALTPGLSRMYLGQHWASDIFAGAFLGTFYGWRVVQYSHDHERTPVDRVFLPNHSIPLGWTLTF
ncbi:MAG TPA: phosphatase PAP2 family protein [Gemmatimonadaceae bacterium]|nr:phosphatase PAP2 family protein [Gemmatimonadaceae bacterium]